jgi:hypothetical protein
VADRRRRRRISTTTPTTNTTTMLPRRTIAVAREPPLSVSKFGDRDADPSDHEHASHDRGDQGVPDRLAGPVAPEVDNDGDTGQQVQHTLGDHGHSAEPGEEGEDGVESLHGEVHDEQQRDDARGDPGQVGRPCLLVQPMGAARTPCSV